MYVFDLSLAVTQLSDGHNLWLLDLNSKLLYSLRKNMKLYFNL